MKITVKKGDTELILQNNNLSYEVIKNQFHWVGEGRRPHIFFQKKIFGKYLWIPKAFSWAHKIEHKTTEDSIISKFSNFRLCGKKLTLSLVVIAKIVDNGKIDFSIEAENESGMDIKAIYFPRAFNAKRYDKHNSYTVDPMRQGFILPDTYKKNRTSIFLLTKHWRNVNTGSAYLPLWGRVCGQNGYAGVIDSSYDSSLFSCYGKKKALLTSSNWLGSLGKVDYKRLTHYHFYDKCDYVTIAKEFRKQEVAQGKLTTIDEKIKSNPKVANLAGASIIHWRVLEHNSPLSKTFKQNHIGDKLHYTFEQTAELFEKFSKFGLKNVYVHTDGWGKNGYDNLHPYILPPCEKAGGYEGMRKLSDTCQKLGYQFGLHDQYRDFYQDSPSYDPDCCVTDINGKKPYCDVWSGGAHNWLCAKFAKPFVERTYRELAENNVKIDGAYLDVFGIVLGDECYDKNHPTTRKQCIDYRIECFDMLRKQGLIVSSEEIGCQMINCLDLVHHAPYSITPQDRGERTGQPIQKNCGEQVGIPIPLANLVYHDCVFVPWYIEGKGGWGIPYADAGRLHCILNGQSPYFNNSMEAYAEESDEQLKARIDVVNECAEVNAKVFNAEMISHKFLENNYRKQQTEFSNGIVITVDFDEDTYKIEKRLV